jgi:hypothetical protein
VRSGRRGEAALAWITAVGIIAVGVTVVGSVIDGVSVVSSLSAHSHVNDSAVPDASCSSKHTTSLSPRTI